MDREPPRPSLAARASRSPRARAPRSLLPALRRQPRAAARSPSRPPAGAAEAAPARPAGDPAPGPAPPGAGDPGEGLSAPLGPAATGTAPGAPGQGRWSGGASPWCPRASPGPGSFLGFQFWHLVPRARSSRPHLPGQTSPGAKGEKGSHGHPRSDGGVFKVGLCSSDGKVWDRLGFRQSQGFTPGLITSQVSKTLPCGICPASSVRLAHCRIPSALTRAHDRPSANLSRKREEVLERRIPSPLLL